MDFLEAGDLTGELSAYLSGPKLWEALSIYKRKRNVTLCIYGNMNLTLTSLA